MIQNFAFREWWWSHVKCKPHSSLGCTIFIIFYVQSCSPFLSFGKLGILFYFVYLFIYLFIYLFFLACFFGLLLLQRWKILIRKVFWDGIHHVHLQFACLFTGDITWNCETIILFYTDIFTRAFFSKTLKRNGVHLKWNPHNGDPFLKIWPF